MLFKVPLSADNFSFYVGFVYAISRGDMTMNVEYSVLPSAHNSLYFAGHCVPRLRGHLCGRGHAPWPGGSRHPERGGHELC